MIHLWFICWHAHNLAKFFRNCWAVDGQIWRMLTLQVVAEALTWPADIRFHMQILTLICDIRRQLATPPAPKKRLTKREKCDPSCVARTRQMNSRLRATPSPHLELIGGPSYAGPGQANNSVKFKTQCLQQIRRLSWSLSRGNKKSNHIINLSTASGLDF